MSSAESHSRLMNIDANTTEKELVDIYKTWSKTYDRDVLKDILYVAPEKAAEHLSSKLKEFGFSSDISILDLGSGTGLVGESLYKQGYRNLDGVDISPELIDVSREKGVYRKLFLGSMASEGSQKLGIEANTYDAAICIGVFTIGHVKAKGLDDLVHVVKPGGLVCFTIRDCIANDPLYGYNEKMDELTKEQKWKLIFKIYEVYHDVNKFRSWLYIYQVL